MNGIICWNCLENFLFNKLELHLKAYLIIQRLNYHANITLKPTLLATDVANVVTMSDRIRVLSLGSVALKPSDGYRTLSKHPTSIRRPSDVAMMLD